jgi:hypothetical protein
VLDSGRELSRRSPNLASYLCALTSTARKNYHDIGFEGERRGNDLGLRAMAGNVTDWTATTVRGEAVVLPGGGVSPLIVEAAAAFERELPELLRTHRGRWISYYGPQRLAIADREPDLVQTCYNNGYEDKDLYVRRIEEPISVSVEW